MSKTALLSPLANVVTIILAIIFLDEIKGWNILLTIGIIIVLFSVFLLKKNGIRNSSSKNWFLFAGIMVIIFGTAVFLRKIFSQTPLIQWLTFWYLGALIGTIPILFLEKNNPLHFPGKLIFLVPLVSLAILFNLATQFWAIDSTLISRTESFRLIGTTFIPAILGWSLFKEGKKFSKKEWLAFLLGVIGALTIILSK